MDLNYCEDGKARVHQSLALSILNKNAAYRENYLCIF